MSDIVERLERLRGETNADEYVAEDAKDAILALREALKDMLDLAGYLPSEEYHEHYERIQKARAILKGDHQ
jgi:hypothetical protein